MTIYLTRDSVANSDDVGLTHRFIVSDNILLSEILRSVLSQCYLPRIAGGEATWSVVSGIPVAVMAQQWAEAKLLPMLPAFPDNLNFSDDTLYLHFNYHAQMAPEIVYEVLRRLQLPARTETN